MSGIRFNYLIKQLKTKLQAFISLYEYYFPKIVIHIHVKFQNRSLAEDVAQEFFIKLLKMQDMDYIKSPNAWVYTIAENIAKNMMAKDGNANKVPLEESTKLVNAVFKLRQRRGQRRIEPAVKKHAGLFQADILG